MQKGKIGVSRSDGHSIIERLLSGVCWKPLTRERGVGRPLPDGKTTQSRLLRGVGCKSHKIDRHGGGLCSGVDDNEKNTKHVYYTDIYRVVVFRVHSYCIVRGLHSFIPQPLKQSTNKFQLCLANPFEYGSELSEKNNFEFAFELGSTVYALALAGVEQSGHEQLKQLRSKALKVYCTKRELKLQSITSKLIKGVFKLMVVKRQFKTLTFSYFNCFDYGIATCKWIILLIS